MWFVIIDVYLWFVCVFVLFVTRKSKKKDFLECLGRGTRGRLLKIKSGSVFLECLRRGRKMIF
jgi:hypothetical protein